MKNYNDVLQVMKGADIWSWHWDTQWLSIYLDDYAADRRTVYDVRLKDGKCEVKTLCGYSPVKHSWGEYCSPRGTLGLTSHGKKALLEYIKSVAIKLEGRPNPPSVHCYKGQP